MDNGNDSEIEVTDEEFSEIIKNNDIVVVNFFAEWHMPCLMLAPVIEDLIKDLKHVRFLKVNIDDNQELKEKHNVTTMPCIIIFKNGQEINRIIGNHSPEIFEEKIKSCVNC